MTDSDRAGTSPFAGDWTEGTAALLVSQCQPCGHRWYLRRSSCPRCGSVDVARTAAGGPGRVAAVTVVHRRVDGGDAVGIALIDLEEGVRVMARCPPGTPVGQAVVVGIVIDEGPNGSPSLLPSVLGTESRAR